MNYKDVLIRIRQATDSESTRYPVEAQIDGEGVWRGTSEFDFRALDPGRGSPRDYGIALGEQLLNSSIKRALEQAGAGQGQRVRIRLLVDDDVGAPLALRWERMYLDVGTEPWPIATSPEIAFSRYIPSERADAAPPDDTVFRILLAIANPTNLPGALQIDVSAAVARLFEEFRNTVSTPRFRIRVLPGRSGLSPNLASQLAEANWDIADGPATLENISRWVNRDGGYHALHIIAHGKFNPAQSEGILFLESNEGWMNPVKDYELEGWIHPKLQLMILQACKSAAQPPFGEPPFVAIAPKMVSFGVPAVVAMQDFVLMTDAAAFAVAFYRSLMREGLVDVAAGEGRQAMSRAASRIDPSIPALFTRLEESASVATGLGAQRR